MNLENIKLIRLNLKEYRVEIFWLLVSGALSNLLIHFSYYPLHLYVLNIFHSDYDFFPLPLSIFRILFWLILFMILRSISSGLRTFFSQIPKNEYGFNTQNKKKSSLTEEKFKRDFEFQGNVYLNNNKMIVCNTPSGCLIKNIWWYRRIWKNFTAQIEVEFYKQEKKINPFYNAKGKLDNMKFNKYLGIIFRAQSFDDYFMLELCKIGRYLVIRPHVRVGGNWDAPELNTNENAILLSDEQLSITMTVKDRVVKLSINNKRQNLNWILPTHVKTNLMYPGGRDNSLAKTSTPEIYFKDKAGMFGFRNYGNELAIIKSLNIS